MEMYDGGVSNVVNAAKLNELLYRISSEEIKLCSGGTKELLKLLKSDNGSQVVRQYVIGSPKCSELLQAWKLRQSKQKGLRYIFNLISTLLNNHDHENKKVLDDLARLIINVENDYLNDLYNELNCNELKRKKAVLLLLSSIVRRGSSLAWEVYKSFDFKLKGFIDLVKKNKLLRNSFVQFAMSFLKVGKPRLLRSILQKKEIYSSVLRGLENDVDDTVYDVLSTLKYCVLDEKSMVPPGLRSVLFGSITLEQLVSICGREDEDVAEIAFDVLLLVFTDPSNGLVPDSKRHLKGNIKRTMDLFNKLWPAEVHYHKKLLMAIFNAKPSFGFLYLKEFPYVVENYKSSSEISAKSLAADLVSSINEGISKEVDNSESNATPSIDNMNLIDTVKCLFPRPFSRSMFNKGLQHADTDTELQNADTDTTVKHTVKHDTLKLLLELLKLLDSLFGTLNHNSSSDKVSSIKQEILNYVRPFLPDLQLLLNLLSSLVTSYEFNNSSLKRNTCHHELDGNTRKKLKMDTSESDTGMNVDWTSSNPDIDSSGNSGTTDNAEDAESHLLPNLLDALRYYHRTLTFTSDHSFDSFKGLLKNPLELTSHLQISLLSLLVEYIQWCPENEIPIRTPAMLYKDLQPFIKLFMFSPISEIKKLAYRLAIAAMFSTGAFDGNRHEIHAWLLFLPGYQREQSPVNISEVGLLQSLTLSVITFFCEAVTTLGNNLFKYWNILKNYVDSLEGDEDLSLDVSPFVICVLEKCLKVIRPKSGTCSLPKISMKLLYTCNTVKYLLQTQVNAELLSSVVNAYLTERLDSSYEYDQVFPKWKPLKNLLDFVKGISRQRNCCLFSGKKEHDLPDGSLGSALGDVNRLLGGRDGHQMAETTVAFISSIACDNSDKVSKNLPPGTVISPDKLGVPFSLLPSIFCLDYSVLVHASKMWSAGFVKAISDLGSDSQTAATIEISEADDADAFRILLKQTPFHVIFPAMICMNGHDSSMLSKMQELLLQKLSESANDHSLFPSLQLVLFWTHQIQLSHIVTPLADIDQLLNLCVTLVQKLLAQLLVPESGSDLSKEDSAFSSSSHYIEEVTKTICCHPSVLMSLSSSLGNCSNISDFTRTDFDILKLLSSDDFKKIRNPILNILTTTLDNMWLLLGAHLCGSKAQDVTNNFVKTFQGLQHKLLLDAKNKIELCIETKDMTPLLPTLYALDTLHRFLSPFQVLELVDKMFERVEKAILDLSTKISFLSVGCCFAAYAFSALSVYFQHSSGNRAPYDLFWEMGENNLKGAIVEQIYSKVVDFSLNYEIVYADSCLHEALSAFYKQKNMQQETFHPFLLDLRKIIMITPVEMLSHRLYKMNAKRAKFLHTLTELSSLHSSKFGHSFLDIVDTSLRHDVGDTRAFDLIRFEDQFILLLPASLSCMKLIFKRFGDLNHEDFKQIPYFYSKILFKGFSQRKSFLSKDIFEEEYGQSVPSSVQKSLGLFDCSLLGKSIHMLQYHFALNGDSLKLKKRLKLFKSICPKCPWHDQLMDCDGQFIVAKISLCKMLLFHEAGQDSKEVAMKMQSKLKASRINFIDVLVDIWKYIVWKFPLSSDQSGAGKNISLLYNHLEVFVLTTILELMQNDHIQSQSIPFLGKLMESGLRYRFSDPMTIKALQVIVTRLNEGRISYDLYLGLLCGHSQFDHTLCSLRRTAGSFLKPVSSILKYIAIPCLDHSENNRKHNVTTTKLSRGPLEIVKLLWILLWKWNKARQAGLDSQKDIGINFKKLHSRLHHSYGGKLSEIDLAIYNVMKQIETVTGSCPQNVELKSEAIEEWTRSQQKGNLPIDPDICVSTVLYFPYDRSMSDEVPSVNKIETDNVRKKIHSSHVEVRERYDPVFILQFSICALSEAYIEPIEFAGSGLLAIAFVSLSSPDHGIQRLAHGTLNKFKNAIDALKTCQNSKDVARLQLLVNYVQNSIKEPFQRLPSVISLFAAEASCVLLDSSHDHYEAISNFLCQSYEFNMKVIPLFDNFIWSSSVNFKAERSWILRLVYAGLNSDDDAMIYIKNSILESLMSFYFSSLLDVGSKDLIVEVIKKSIKVQKMARHLVKHCSLFSWLSSLVSVTRSAELNGDENRFFLKHILAVLKAVNDVVTSRSISKWWLQNHGLEQLTQLSSNLFSFVLQRNVTMTDETAELVDPLLRMIVSVLKFSQERKVCQPHFTFSIEGLYEIYQAGSVCNQAAKGINPDSALEAILMIAPSISIFLMDQEKLHNFITWAITTALKSESSQRLRFNESRIIVKKELGEESHDDSLVSKFLRWLTASVIIGKLHQKSNDIYSGFAEPHKLKSLDSLLEHVKNTSGQRHEINIVCEKLLASTIFYLQLLLGTNQELLPSVVSALCLLTFGASNLPVGRTDLLQCYKPSLEMVRCPPEANPAWRWSFYKPKKDHSPELSGTQNMKEYEACQNLLVMVANVLGGKKLETDC